MPDAIAEAYAALGDDPPVAVRSSACAEDSDTASYAGQQETYLHVRGADAVRDRVRDCWASFFSERAIFYRQKKGSLDDLGMAVVVQRMVRSDVAGVLFTCDPVRGRRDRMVVEAVLGLGEAAVSGQVTPDHYILKRDGTIRKAQVSQQPIAIVPVEDGGTEERELGAEGGEQKLAEDQLRAARRARRRPRAAARRPAGHRVGARGRRAVRAAGAAGDDVISRARAAVDGRRAPARRATWSARSTGCSCSIPARPRRRQIAAATHDVERAYPDGDTPAGTPRATGTRSSTTAGTRTAART